MSDDALVTLAEDARGWLSGGLALPGFVDVVRSIAGEERYRELLLWASRRGPKLSEEKLAELEQLAEMLRELFVRWEFVEVSEASRHAEEWSAE